MRILTILFTVFFVVFLTALTQIGGLIYLVSFSIHTLIDKATQNKWHRASIKFLSFVIMYSVATFLLVPLVAKPFGRVPLPWRETAHLKPLNMITCFLNRHYVRAELRVAAIEVAQEMNTRFPGTVVNYLDANFPFFNRFPLIPHLSHYDGKKLDLAFYYINNKTGKAVNDAPSIIGYGINEDPRANEVHTANICAVQGYWQYDFMSKIIPQGNKSAYKFDSIRTKQIVNLIASNHSIGKIFIEPHLKTRLKLRSEKIRFHGCQAVRHDDHLHIQLK